MILHAVSFNLPQNKPPTRTSVVIPVTGESEGAMVQVRLTEPSARAGALGDWLLLHRPPVTGADELPPPVRFCRLPALSNKWGTLASFVMEAKVEANLQAMIPFAFISGY